MSRLILLCVGRIGTCMGTMAFAGALPVLSREWAMDAATAGAIQTTFNLANALALFVAAYLSDRFGACRIYLFCIWSGALALALFALFAHSAVSALPLITLVGLTQGGAYAPALMLATDLSSTSARGRTMGMVLASGSLGYMLSIVFALWGATKFGAMAGLAICAVGGLIGAIVGHISLAGRKVDSLPPTLGVLASSNVRLDSWYSALGPASFCLLIGYVAHCWELLGNFAWTPSLLATALKPLQLGAITTGLIIGASIHLSGMVATFVFGVLSDAWPRTRVLILVAAAGALCSLLTGMSIQWGPAWTVAVAAIGSFFIFGDSGVLTAAMTEEVPLGRLGRVMGIRSLLGFGAGALAPISFGAIFDSTQKWEWAYSVLAFGGGIALISAITLRFVAAGSSSRAALFKTDAH
ncbi:MFS transporter [Cupriavidus sp. BIC8F]|uniref:MFS transporter n=1 Tax=Cupriavidus sp. BIC8F TaxID=3079014 RepID=UPI0029169F6C|nr:MFS transporter [Cupriavidus sp. BIC8F]